MSFHPSIESATTSNMYGVDCTHAMRLAARRADELRNAALDAFARLVRFVRRLIALPAPAGTKA